MPERQVNYAKISPRRQEHVFDTGLPLLPSASSAFMRGQSPKIKALPK